MYAYIIYMDVEIGCLFCSTLFTFVQSQIVCPLKLHGGCFHCPRYLHNNYVNNKFIYQNLSVTCHNYCMKLLIIIKQIMCVPEKTVFWKCGWEPLKS